MSGLFDSNVEQINSVLWPDAELEALQIGYDFINIKVEESNGLVRIIRCEGYIGFEGVGFWDEIVISEATMLKKHELIDRCLSSISNRLGGSAVDSGSIARNLRDWGLFQIKFIDGTELNIVMSKILVETM